MHIIFKNKKIGDLDKELYITATDIVRGKLKIFNSETKISDAVLASSAFPGIISPVSIDGKLYSDGGILNNFPVTTIQGRCDFIIGINTNAPEMRSVSINGPSIRLLPTNMR